MANSTTGTLKLLIEGAGLSLAAYRDRAPRGEALPYVTIVEAISETPDPLEDGGAAAGTGGTDTGTEVAQVDLWQQWKDPRTSGTGAGAFTEDVTLPRRLRRVLHGADLGSIGSSPALRTYKVLVRSRVRLIEEDARLVHDAFTLEIRREL